MEGHEEPGGPLWALPVCMYVGETAEVHADIANDLIPGEAWL